MKAKKTNTPKPVKTRKDTARGRTQVEGQNPRADDATSQDLYHDENRRNMYDPEVAEALKGKASSRKS